MYFLRSRWRSWDNGCIGWMELSAVRSFIVNESRFIQRFAEPFAVIISKRRLWNFPRNRRDEGKEYTKCVIPVSKARSWWPGFPRPRVTTSAPRESRLILPSIVPPNQPSHGWNCTQVYVRTYMYTGRNASHKEPRSKTSESFPARSSVVLRLWFVENRRNLSRGGLERGKIGKAGGESPLSLVFFIGPPWDMLYIMESQLGVSSFEARVEPISCLCMSGRGPHPPCHAHRRRSVVRHVVAAAITASQRG